MKLNSLLILATYWIIKINAQKSQDIHFPTQFQSSGIFASDSSIYLPPESHTVLPFVTISDSLNKLNFPYLPPSGTKAPNTYPSPYPMIISTTLSNLEELDEDNANTNNGKKILISQQSKILNHTQLNTQNDKREQKQLNDNRNLQRPFEMKFPQFAERLRPTISPSNPTPASRRNIIATEIKMADSSAEQINNPPLFGQQIIHVPNFMSSTTEPAIPILRLSNEMDLDGSFSYEALGADQTHLVQHSHIENQGSDKEEQVVEGSYSYVGDNGQTYTVHYVADSNGYRASGDHLPVPPPVPEIIQRSIQYNLAEEAMKPPHLKSSWSNDDVGNDNIHSNDNHHAYTVLTPQRNLFTGRNPQAFSINFPQNANNQKNNVIAASSSITQTKSNFDIIKDQNAQAKTSNGQISPQITFLASQGAHSPTDSTYQTISRIYTTEKPSLSQLINYESNVKDNTDQGSKGLWRWQYGINSDQLNVTPNKNTISRSSKEGDEVMIHFNDMTGDQYSSILNPITDSPQGYDQINNEVVTNDKDFQTHIEHKYYQNPQETIHYAIIKKPLDSSITEGNSDLQTLARKNSSNHDTSEVKKPQSNINYLINPKNFTYSDDFDYKVYDLNKIESTKKNSNLYLTTTSSRYENQLYNSKYHKASSDDYETKNSITTTGTPLDVVRTDLVQTIYNTHYKNDFKPLFMGTETENEEPTMEDILENNIFLKSLLITDKKEISNRDMSDNYHNKIVKQPEIKSNKGPKYISLQQNYNDLKLNKKTFDMADVLNYALMKNHFESNKIKNKSQSMLSNNKNPERFIQSQQDPVSDNDENYSHNSYNNQRQEDIPSVVKNYKILQRHNVNNNNNNSDSLEFKKKLRQQLDNSYTEDFPHLGRAGPSARNYLPPVYV